MLVGGAGVLLRGVWSTAGVRLSVVEMVPVVAVGRLSVARLTVFSPRHMKSLEQAGHQAEGSREPQGAA